jgi:predicted membrane channel-forming protein YqfA (hemolysin III family)
MKINRPKNVTWWISVILGGLGILSQFVAIPGLSGFSFWLLAIGFVLLVLGTVIKGL